MAKPRIMVSSTCEDLYMIREQLRVLIDDMGYEAVLSEEGDVYYSPDLHIHLSCIREVRNCDMVILIIGNRFGSEHISRPEKSVTQAEHDTAYISSIPVFAFVDRRVLDDYATYRRAIDEAGEEKAEYCNEFIAKIPFGSKSDIRVFKFIDNLRLKVTNNALFPFSNFGDIKEALKKQWAGMLFDFLKQRIEDVKGKKIIDLLGKLEIASGKVEQIVELIADNTLTTEKKKKLTAIDIYAKERRLSFIMQAFWNGFKLDPLVLKNLKIINDRNLGKLYDAMLADVPEKKKGKQMNQISEILQEIGIVESNNYFVDFAVKYRIDEFKETVKRKELSKESVISSMKETLIQALETTQNERN